jgi:hypothetical protein
VNNTKSSMCAWRRSNKKSTLPMSPSKCNRSNQFWSLLAIVICYWCYSFVVVKDLFTCSPPFFGGVWYLRQ